MSKTTNIVYYCPECGSEDVEYKTWYAPNREEITDHCTDKEDTWCHVCEEHTGLAFKEVEIPDRNR